MTDEEAIDIELSEPLHARPASMLVRLASRQTAAIEIAFEGRSANAKKILEVLKLGAIRGSTVRLVARGEHAALALERLSDLIHHGFSTDALPEIATAAAPGMAIGRASLLLSTVADAAPESMPGYSISDDIPSSRRRVHAAFGRAQSELHRLIARLPPPEAQLFEPLSVILMELMNATLPNLEAGMSAVLALDVAAASAGTARSDLVRDALERVRAVLLGVDLVTAELLAGEGDRILVARVLTPSLLVGLPRSFRGIIAEGDTGPGYTSHAAILARGRGLPLVFAPAHVVSAIRRDETIVIESTETSCQFWSSPSAEFLQGARARHDAWLAQKRRDEELARAIRSDTAVRANVGSLDERIPPSADGIGLVRTELLFSGRLSPPGEMEQASVYAALAKGVAGNPCIVRLFDAGGDKPIPWLPGEGRGMDLLLAHPHVFEAQLRAIDRAREHGDVQVLVPMARSAEDIERVRAGLASDAPVGALIETREAADAIEAIARVSDFISVGTNDLASSVLGVDRAVLRWEGTEAFLRDERLLVVVRTIVERAHATGRKVTVCGELAGHPEMARELVALGVDALSVACERIASVKVALGARNR
ncbi:HPr family phosphocarrier protein [Pendulispora rubella]|uniref:HPr family phosphocarrier protein n=1 Tax=Pendulispora rubella TaxID=2741070 RepID=A0ABZ2LFS8_9BACT